MNRLRKIMTATLLGVSLISGTSFAATSGISTEGIYASSDSSQLLTKVDVFAGTGDFGDKNDSTQNSLFRSPAGILVLPDGAVLVSDSKSHQIRKIANGKVTTYAGVFVEKGKQGFPIGGFLDGKSDQTFFNLPSGIAADAKGNIYVADADNHAIRKIEPSGIVTTIAGGGVQGNVDGKGNAAKFNHPMDVVVTSEGILYVADTLNNTIRKVTPDGVVTTITAISTRTVTLVSGKILPLGDFKDGNLKQAKFNEPSGLALDSKGNLYVSDSGNQRIRYIDLSSGTVNSLTGNDQSAVYEKGALYATGDYADGLAEQALFNYPVGIALSLEGGLIIADSLNHSVRYLHNGKVSTLAGEKEQFPGELNGIERIAKLNVPTDVAVMADGTILVADSFNNKIRTINLYNLPSELPKDDNIKVVLDNKQIIFDSKPEITAGRTMVPMRKIAEALGYKVTYIDIGQIIQMSKGNLTIELAIGNKEIKRMVKGNPDIVHSMDVMPYINSGGNTLLPVRFFAEEVGLDVQWNSANRTAILRYPYSN